VKQDPLALAFFGAALAVLAGLLLYVFVFKTPEPATERTPVRAGLEELSGQHLPVEDVAAPDAEAMYAIIKGQSGAK